ncbi:uncharacterized protein LOC126657236 [Mercurialis annua]|uniref:uncharacterized protein LOC126657236 n=1 Tax=Mercurialis annua TaxID=3986 RepID=UPI0021601E86|nr:uncharacterized protein LOC126657236 [Mercurialis annua]
MQLFVSLKIIVEEYQIADWACRFIEEYQAAVARPRGDNRERDVISRRTEDKRWVPPDKGIFKINVDAGFDRSRKIYSTGVVIRDWEGRVRVTEERWYQGHPEVSLGEACAIRNGIRLAYETNLTPYEISSDSKVAVESFNNTNMQGSDMSLIVEDCSKLEGRNFCLGIYFAGRNTNFVAHELAKRALAQSQGCLRRMGNAPPEIHQFVMADLTSPA